MEEAGLRHVRAAQEDGRWEAAYAPASEMTLPDDFLAALEERPDAKAFSMRGCPCCRRDAWRGTRHRYGAGGNPRRGILEIEIAPFAAETIQELSAAGTRFSVVSSRLNVRDETMRWLAKHGIADCFGAVSLGEDFKQQAGGMPCTWN